MNSKVFIHHDGALGDVILSLPAMSLIRAHSDFIHLAARADIVNLLLQLGFIEEATRADSSKYLSLYAGCPDEHLRSFLGQFHKAFIFTANEDTVIASSLKNILFETSLIKTIPSENSNIHIAEFRLKQLADSPQLTADETSNYLKIPQVCLQRSYELLINSGYKKNSPLLAIHPGSGGLKKCWALEYYFELIDLLMRRYNPFVIIFSGSAESETAKAEINNFISGKRNIVHIFDTELIMAASLLSLCDIYLGNDSGISHLASLFCRYVVAIFGPTDPSLWKPASKNTVIISSDSECAPCNKIILRECEERRCLSGIPVSRVYKVIEDLFAPKNIDAPPSICKARLSLA